MNKNQKKIEPVKELEKAENILAELEQLITSQNVPYMLHVERLAGLKYLHTRLQELKRLEETSNDRGVE